MYVFLSINGNKHIEEKKTFTAIEMLAVSLSLS
jgi:hypothetical protein